MMLQKIKSRLQAVEMAKQKVNVPDLVFIYWDARKCSWVAKEQYTKKDSKGKVVPLSGRTKTIKLDSPDSYKAPEGFIGRVLIEGDIE